MKAIEILKAQQTLRVAVQAAVAAAIANGVSPETVIDIVTHSLPAPDEMHAPGSAKSFTTEGVELTEVKLDDAFLGLLAAPNRKSKSKPTQSKPTQSKPKRTK